MLHRRHGDKKHSAVGNVAWTCWWLTLLLNVLMTSARTTPTRDTFDLTIQRQREIVWPFLKLARSQGTEVGPNWGFGNENPQHLRGQVDSKKQLEGEQITTFKTTSPIWLCQSALVTQIAADLHFGSG